MMDKRFNIRLYGLLFHKNSVLVSDEFLGNAAYTKFPGGGLEWGEGIHAGLEREFREELALEVKVHELFYLTDFFQASAYNNNHQVISIYFKVSCSSPDLIKVKQNKFDFHENKHGAQAFRWVEITSLTEEDFHFPIDKVVVAKLRNGG